MLKIFSILDQWLPKSAQTEADIDKAWVRDPLRHPDIARMDARELGDLPFPGRVVRARPKLLGKACGA